MAWLYFFALGGSGRIKASHNKLVKSTPGLQWMSVDTENGF